MLLMQLIVRSKLLDENISKLNNTETVMFSLSVGQLLIDKSIISTLTTQN